jgi:hypothetical protein
MGPILPRDASGDDRLKAAILPAGIMRIDGRLPARYSGRQTLIKQLRPYLYGVSAAVGIFTRIVPYQLRHYLSLHTSEDRMIVIERLTAAQIRLRSPPLLATAIS